MSIPEWITLMDKRVTAYEEYLQLLEEGSTDKEKLLELRNTIFGLNKDIVNNIVDDITASGELDTDTNARKAMMLNEALAEYKNNHERKKTRKDFLSADFERLKKQAVYEVLR